MATRDCECCGQPTDAAKRTCEGCRYGECDPEETWHCDGRGGHHCDGTGCENYGEDGSE